MIITVYSMGHKIYIRSQYPLDEIGYRKPFAPWPYRTYMNTNWRKETINTMCLPRRNSQLLHRDLYKECIKEVYYTLMNSRWGTLSNSGLIVDPNHARECRIQSFSLCTLRNYKNILLMSGNLVEDAVNTRLPIASSYVPTTSDELFALSYHNSQKLTCGTLPHSSNKEDNAVLLKFHQQHYTIHLE